MKRLVICCDGTWNRADQVQKDGQPCVTNVVKTAVRVAKRDGDVAQIIYYDQGVGTGNLVDRIQGGVAGEGLEANIHDAYRFIVGNYELGDEIFLFGFSRGAFTARSIGGMIRKCGILQRTRADQYHAALELYRSDARAGDEKPVAFRKANSISPDQPIPIEFIGVWDTVGALGIPGEDKHAYAFHDTQLGPNVRFAYHALAIDERRGPFQPTLWNYDPKAAPKIEQMWFAGVHSDVGGGYEQTGLSDIALQWMLDKSQQAGLVLDADVLAARPLHPNPLQKPPHDSLSLKYKLMRRYERPVCVPSEESKESGPNGLDPTQAVHPSVLQRWDGDESYRPPKLRDYFRRVGDPRGNQ
ncbi:MAG TPA: DUF2235 domain-containing protein [Thermoanaerobaculia bacterium]|jgi:uncharacterized protein (DUF2235 family)